MSDILKFKKTVKAPGFIGDGSQLTIEDEKDNLKEVLSRKLNKTGDGSRLTVEDEKDNLKEVLNRKLNKTGDGSRLTVEDEEGNLKNALDKKFDKSGGKIDGALNVGGKFASGNACQEAWKGNEIATSKRGYEDMPDMIVNVHTGDSLLYILFVVSEAWLSGNGYAYYRLLVDDEEKAVTRNHFVSRHSSVVLHRICPVKTGRHIIKAQWFAQSETAKSIRSRTLTVIEMKCEYKTH